MLMPSIFGENLFDDWMDFYSRLLTEIFMEIVPAV